MLILIELISSQDTQLLDFETLSVRFIPLIFQYNGTEELNMSSQHTPSKESAAKSRLEFARTLTRGGMEGAQIISQQTADEVLTQKRRELISALETEQIESVRGLARMLDRDKAAVSRDLKLLAEHGIVDFDADGQAKRPYLQHDHLVVEPVF
ncbi:HVO_A0114 family putative DNA-binding protein [Haloarcula halophila]|uniref:HVO_A0114 family putative DNA-binding protein n=1 Tax=Halomicroarcula sp. GCM10025335 TaxID=3252668 RepID=UPI00360D1204